MNGADITDPFVALADVERFQRSRVREAGPHPALEREHTMAERDAAEPVARGAHAWKRRPTATSRVVLLDRPDRAAELHGLLATEYHNSAVDRGRRDAAATRVHVGHSFPALAGRKIALNDREVAWATAKHVEGSAGDRTGYVLARNGHVGASRRS